MSAQQTLSIPCPHCSIGGMRLRSVTFAHWFAADFVVMPNFPAWQCDACGVCEYDAEALEQLGAILGPEAELRRARTGGTPPNARRPRAAQRLPGRPSV